MVQVEITDSSIAAEMTQITEDLNNLLSLAVNRGLLVQASLRLVNQENGVGIPFVQVQVSRPL